jgi:hypothetical protein
MKFVYSLIRYVPDPMRGEFVNVGAIAGSDESSEWEVRQVENPIRARQFDESGSLPAVFAFIDQLARSVDAFEDSITSPTLDEPEISLSEDWLTAVHSDHRNIVQLSPPLPLIADSATEALDRVFDELIVDPARRSGSQNKHPALAAARKAYGEAGLHINQDFFERVIIEAGQHRQKLDFAVANGRVVQLAEAWSFQVADQERLADNIKSWGWTMKAVQEDGGVIHVAERELEVPKEVDIAVVYVPPSADDTQPALADAKAVLDRLDATQLEVAGAQPLGEIAADLLAA